MNQGVIAYLGKGFGFIKVDGRAKDLFFHAKGLAQGLDFADLSVGEALSYEDITRTEKGEAAIGINRA